MDNYQMPQSEPSSASMKWVWIVVVIAVAAALFWYFRYRPTKLTQLLPQLAPSNDKTTDISSDFNSLPDAPTQDFNSLDNNLNSL